MKKEIMKNLFWLICVLSLSYSCKQTQLALSNNKKSDKIYTKAPLSLNDIDFVSKEKKASKPSRSIIITKAVKKQLYSTENSIERELFTDLDNTKPNLIKNEKRIHQKLVRIDSILKSQVSNLENEEEVLDLSKKAKRFSIRSILSSSLLISFNLIDDLIINDIINNRKLRWIINDIVEILSWVLGGLCFILSLFTLYFLIKAFKKIKKSREKLKNQNDVVKKNLRWAGLSTVYHLIIPMILTIWLIIYVTCCLYISI